MRLEPKLWRPLPGQTTTRGSSARLSENDQCPSRIIARLIALPIGHRGF